jgi:hypothetical protein
MQELKQPPFNASMMGVVKGVIDHYGLGHSPAMAYGGSGHAFLINIHKAICPSGPYCWNYDGFVRLLRNLGLEMTDLGFCSLQSSPDERKRLEQAVMKSLDEGRPCSALNMENQIVYGYDAGKLLLAQPWRCEVPVTPASLSLGTWEEFGQEVHANFYSFGKLQPADARKTVRDSLEYAADLFANPGKHSSPKYSIGPAAYDTWMAAVGAGHGASHGNWWNATVWSECRAMASAYFAELADVHRIGDPKLAERLTCYYKEIADDLELVADKEMDREGKAGALGKLKETEGAAIDLVGDYLKTI